MRTMFWFLTNNMLVFATEEPHRLRARLMRGARTDGTETVVVVGGTNEEIVLENKDQLYVDISKHIVNWAIYDQSGEVETSETDQIYRIINNRNIWLAEDGEEFHFTGYLLNSKTKKPLPDSIESGILCKIIPLGQEMLAVTTKGSFLLYGRPMRKEVEA